MSAVYTVKLRLLAAFRYLLVPLVRILLRNGISFNEISEVLKGAYTRVAATDFAVPGRTGTAGVARDRSRSVDGPGWCGSSRGG